MVATFCEAANKVPLQLLVKGIQPRVAKGIKQVGIQLVALGFGIMPLMTVECLMRLLAQCILPPVSKTVEQLGIE